MIIDGSPGELTPCHDCSGTTLPNLIYDIQNVGGGIGLFRDKVGITANFKTLLAGTNIFLIQSADTITINSSGGTGGLFSGVTQTEFNFYTGTTAPNTFLSIEDFNIYSGGTSISLANGNGLTFNTDHYDLGGYLTNDAVIQFDGGDLIKVQSGFNGDGNRITYFQTSDGLNYFGQKYSFTDYYQTTFFSQNKTVNQLGTSGPSGLGANTLIYQTNFETGTSGENPYLKIESSKEYGGVGSKIELRPESLDITYTDSSAYPYNGGIKLGNQNHPTSPEILTLFSSGRISIEPGGGFPTDIYNSYLSWNVGSESVYLGGGLFQDQRAVPTGIVYEYDYSGTFIDESLITKRYVDTVIGSISYTPYGYLGNCPLSSIAMSPNITQDGYAVTWDNTTNEFTLSPTLGITRDIQYIGGSGAVSMASTANKDYVYIIYGNNTPILPSASGHYRMYTVANEYSSSITIQTTGAQTINGTSTLSLPAGQSVSLVSDYGSGWHTVGNYSVGGSSGTTYSAGNGITKKGSNRFTLGGVLTGSTTIGLATNNLIVTGTTGTLRYGSDLSAQFNVRSIVDKGYVTGITTTLLSKSSFNTYSGATLTNINSRLLTSSFNTYSGATATRISTVENNYVTGYTSLGNTSLIGSKLGKKLRFKGLIAGSNISLTSSTSGVTISVTGGTTYSANNGITKSPANNFHLGGALTGNTTINASSYSLSVGYGSTGAFNINGLIKSVAVTGASLTLNDDLHRGKILYCTNSSSITITVPTGLPLGFNCVIIQDGVGTVSLSASGTTLRGKVASTVQYDSISLALYKSSETYIGL